MVDCTGTDENVDSLYDCMSHPRRRHALHCLQESGEPLALADLAADVAACETEFESGAVPHQTVKDVQIGLYHVHIPKLVDADLVRFDSERGVVELASSFQQLREDPALLLAE